MRRFRLFQHMFVRSLAFWSAGVLVLAGSVLIAEVAYTFAPGDVVSADQINANFQALDGSLADLKTKNTTLETEVAGLQTVLAPVGSIVAWHKNLTGVPGIPAGWLECNGQQILDPDSLLQNQWTPNLNGERRFLRGGNASGAPEDDAFQSHRHAIHRDIGQVTSVGYGKSSALADGGIVRMGTGHIGKDLYVGEPIIGVGGAPRTAAETRPINMSVVWIMRIK